MRVGPRFNVNCSNDSNILASDGRELSWCENVRYLGIYLKASKQYSCLFSQAKCSYYRAFNAVYGKVGSVASKEVIVQLLKSKCLPVLHHSLEACPLNRSDHEIMRFLINKS